MGEAVEQWVILPQEVSIAMAYEGGGEDVPTPDLVTTWWTGWADEPAPTVTSAVHPSDALASWPAWSGLVGALDFQTADAGVLEITHRPTSLNLSGLRQKLLETPELQLVLQSTGLSRLFLQAPTDEEAVAAAATALVVHNQDVVF